MWSGKNVALIKTKTQLSAGKVLITVFWDFRSVLHHQFAYYYALLDESKLGKKNWVFQYETLLFCITVPDFTPEFILDSNEKSSLQSYLVTSNYHIFSFLKEELGRSRLENDTFISNQLEPTLLFLIMQ